ncbi:DUF2851 family protein [Synoicihabitans lomoniglobus]|uniref:DUF2851 family protein n=1 Tax=Synoicihabitans lomoniglobus TaxID=2909285 RepID=A0AAF0CRF7_9BACT|nr:DUF2851 family protein [Opitutaceae bacterium LMO-M01]WED66710.1 DUF2851 family protein [Opitutaceae bacterium LMO-M01]
MNSGRRDLGASRPDLDSTGAVMEMQGLFGPFQFPELLLQRIWADRAFSVGEATTQNGERIKVDHPGRWNRLGGPDFKDARLRIGGRQIDGDVEIHLHESDWRAHGHGNDAHYDGVVLHVVLYPSSATTTATNGDRASIPVLALLPLLWHDLEEYAADAAVSSIADRPADRLAAEWLEMSPRQARARLRGEARKRWDAKVHYARLRIQRTSWREACHLTAMEILGYRFNRVGMLRAAIRWPLALWGEDGVETDEVFMELAADWKLNGVRPANHPRRRLASYARWVRQGGTAWPDRLIEQARAWPGAALDTDDSGDRGVRQWRRDSGYANWWREVMAAVGAAEHVPCPRADNLWGDGFLPLLAAGGHLGEVDGFAWWFISRPGDQPANVSQAVRLIGVANGGREPLAWGHVQGMLGWQNALERDVRRRT